MRAQRLSVVGGFFLFIAEGEEGVFLMVLKTVFILRIYTSRPDRARGSIPPPPAVGCSRPGVTSRSFLTSAVNSANEEIYSRGVT